MGIKILSLKRQEYNISFNRINFLSKNNSWEKIGGMAPSMLTGLNGEL
jgi:hypothetical protein